MTEYSWKKQPDHGNEEYRLKNTDTGEQLFAVYEEDGYHVYLRPQRLGPAYELEDEDLLEILLNEYNELEQVLEGEK